MQIVELPVTSYKHSCDWPKSITKSTNLKTVSYNIINNVSYAKHHFVICIILQKNAKHNSAVRFIEYVFHFIEINTYVYSIHYSVDNVLLIEYHFLSNRCTC